VSPNRHWRTTLRDSAFGEEARTSLSLLLVILCDNIVVLLRCPSLFKVVVSWGSLVVVTIGSGSPPSYQLRASTVAARSEPATTTSAANRMTVPDGGARHGHACRCCDAPPSASRHRSCSPPLAGRTDTLANKTPNVVVTFRCDRKMINNNNDWAPPAESAGRLAGWGQQRLRAHSKGEAAAATTTTALDNEVAGLRTIPPNRPDGPSSAGLPASVPNGHRRATARPLASQRRRRAGERPSGGAR
jgi:hypothetical protein